MSQTPAEVKEYDLAIVGAGPAALSAALYGARLGLDLKVFERTAFGGALTQIAQISNFPGFEGSGADLAQKIKEQAVQSGAQFQYGECTNIERRDSGLELLIDEQQVRSRAVLVATGSEPRPLGLSVAPPVSYCALCDADLARGKNIAVVGGGNSALQESLVLAPLVKNLTLISRSQLRASANLQNKVRKVHNIEILTDTPPSVELLDRFDRIFVFIGHRPATGCLGKAASQSGLLDKDGYIRAAIDQKYPHGTVIPGLFAAGDIRSGSTRQAITAAADGVEAVIEIAEYLKS